MGTAKRPEASIILPCRNEGNNIKMTINSIRKASTQINYEIIVVDDNSEDGCCDFLRKNRPFYKVKLITTNGVGAANARNLGAEKAGGEILVFCDAHVVMEANWLDKLVQSLSVPGVEAVCPGIAPINSPQYVGFGQTWDNKLAVQWLTAVPGNISPIPLAPGGCVAIKVQVFHDVGGFERGFRVWGYEDVELSLKLWLFGYQVYVNPFVKVLHLFRQRHPYLVTMREYNYNLLRMAFSHFNQKRITKVIQMIQQDVHLPYLITEIIFSDIWEQRKKYMARRRYSDDWFMQRFNIPF